MFRLLLAAVLVASAFGARGNLTIYSGPHCQQAQVPGTYGQPCAPAPTAAYNPYTIAAQVAGAPTVVAAAYSPYYYYPQNINPAFPAALKVPNVRAIYDRPFVLVTRNSSAGQQGLTACIVQDGLVSLAENACAYKVYQNLTSGKSRYGFLFNPRSFDVNRLYPAKKLNIVRYEIPQNIRLKDLARVHATNMPWLLVVDSQEFQQSVRTWGLVKIAQVGVTEKTVQVQQQYNPFLIPGYPYYTQQGAQAQTYQYDRE